MPGKMPFLIRLARLTYGNKLKAHGRLTYVNSCGADLSGGPYLILSNHVGALDPIMISTVFPRHIRWVAGAYLFKTRFMHKLLTDWCTAIPKQQGRQDLGTFRKVHKALMSGDNVGLFPEGTRTWDGEMVPLAYKPLAKLLKIYKVNVLFVHLEGGYARSPRWANHTRRGKVVVNFRHLLTPEEIEKTDVPELQQKIQDYLRFSNDEWKETTDYEYVSPKRAEGLQRLLYLCPSCKALDSFKTQGNRIICSKCNTITVLDEKDNLTSIDTPFSRLSQWHEWEAEEISRFKEFPPEEGVLLQKGDYDDEGDLETLSKHFVIHLRENAMHLEFPGSSTRPMTLPLSEVSSLVLNLKQTMELFCGEDLYRIRLLPEANSLKYLEYFTAYKKKAKEAEL